MAARIPDQGPQHPPTGDERGRCDLRCHGLVEAYTRGVLFGWKMTGAYCRAVLLHNERIALDGAPAETVCKGQGLGDQAAGANRG